MDAERGTAARGSRAADGPLWLLYEPWTVRPGPRSFGKQSLSGDAALSGHTLPHQIEKNLCTPDSSRYGDGIKRLESLASLVSAVAQLGERYVRNVEVRGSIPLSSTKSSEIFWALFQGLRRF